MTKQIVCDICGATGEGMAMIYLSNFITLDICTGCEIKLKMWLREQQQKAHEVAYEPEQEH